MTNNMDLSFDVNDTLKITENQGSRKKHWLWVTTVSVLGLCNVLQFCYNRQSNKIGQEFTTSNSVGQVPHEYNRRLQTNNINEVSTMQHNAIPGWNPVYVYTGETNTLDDRGRMFHGQLQQDEWVLKVLNNKRNGYFIDLAANNAVGLSNTYALEKDYDWNGLCIEPNPEYWYGLAFRKCQTVGAMVGKTNDEEVTVVFNKKHLAGIEFKGTKRKDSTTRRTASLKQVFELFNVPSKIDYLSLDVEGAELFIMEAFPFDKYQFSVLTIEWVPDDLRTLLMRNGYRLVHHFKDWETMWVHISMNANGLIREHQLTKTWTGETTTHVHRVSMPGDP